jgi:branched-chain amino acid transport system permease protein
MALWTRLRALPLWVLPLILGIVLLVLPQFGLPFAVSRQIQLTLILALVVSGLNLSLGYAGELALGQAAMYAAGAYAAGILSKSGQTDLLLQLAVGAIVALIVGVVTGIPGLRLGGWSLAMTSFFLILLVPDVLAIFKEVTGGRNGLTGIVPPTLFGMRLTDDHVYIAIAVVAILWFTVFRNIIVSRHGVAFRVLKRSPVLASSLGISVFRMKLLAYALGAVPAGLAGVLFANLDLYISPEAFAFTFATTVLAASVLGGSASIYGALVGAAILQFGLNQSSDFQEYALVFTGAFLVIGGVFLTGGLAGVIKGLIGRVDAAAARSAAAKNGTPVAPPTASVDVGSFEGKTLTVTDVSKSFGGNKALKDVSLTAPPGRVTALIGPNGSGKTTLLNMVCGFYRTDSGTIDLDGKQLQTLSPDAVARAGVARTFQTPHIPEGVSVFDAIVSGRYISDRASILSAVLRTPGFRRVRRADREQAERVLELVGLSRFRDAEATSLPLGMRRLLEVARSLVSHPGVLLLDEVASGLDEHDVDLLAEVIRKVTAAGGTVVLVEHNFQLVLSLADEIVVLAHGEVMAKGTPAEIESNPRVLSEYLGVDPDELVDETGTELER